MTFYVPNNYLQQQHKNQYRNVLFGLTLIVAFMLVSCFIYEVLNIITWVSVHFSRHSPWPTKKFSFFDYNQTLLILTFLIILSPLSSSINKIREIMLDHGFQAITSLGALPLATEPVLLTLDAKRLETRLKQVVHEISVVAGLKEPDIFIMPKENGINALAIGLDQNEAALVFTGGALTNLTRDELSALIAHEITHISNDNMRHNTLMAGWLYGFFFLTILARKTFHSLDSDENTPLFYMTILIAMAGWCTSQIGLLIQVIFSRKNISLADSFSLEFTRDPKNLANVFKKIGGLRTTSGIKAKDTPAYQHLFLACPELRALNLIKSHPSLKDRIWTLEPSWDGVFKDFETNPAIQSADLDNEEKQ